jgi:hypothetical protein
MKKLLFTLSIFGLFGFTTQTEPQTVKLELSVEEVNLIFEGLGELPAKKSEGLRAKLYQEAKKQLEAK